MSDIPKNAVRAFNEQRRNANRRSIPFLFSLPEWWAWWQIDSRWLNRGRSRSQFCMARKGDTGPYSPENVDCVTNSKNVGECNQTRPAETRSRVGRTNAGEGYWRGVRDAHPRSRAIITPLGRFGSGAQAAEAHGINPSTATQKARTGSEGWFYE